MSQLDVGEFVKGIFYTDDLVEKYDICNGYGAEFEPYSTLVEAEYRAVTLGKPHEHIWAEFYLTDDSRCLVIPLRSAPAEFLYLANTFLVAKQPYTGRRIAGVLYDDRDSYSSIEQLYTDLKNGLDRKSIDLPYYQEHDKPRHQLRKHYVEVYHSAFAAEDKYLSTADATAKQNHRQVIEVVDDLLLNYCKDATTGEPSVYHHQVSDYDALSSHAMMGKAFSERHQSLPENHYIEEYINTDWFQHPTLDWLCMDIMIYREYYTGCTALYAAKRGLVGIAIDHWTRNGKIHSAIAPIVSGLWILTYFCIAWGITAVGLVFLYAINTLLAVVAGAGVVAYQIYKYRGRKKYSKILDKVSGIYRMMTNQAITWKVVGREIEDLRTIDILLPKAVWNIVERNKGL